MQRKKLHPKTKDLKKKSFKTESQILKKKKNMTDYNLTSSSFKIKPLQKKVLEPQCFMIMKEDYIIVVYGSEKYC